MSRVGALSVSACSLLRVLNCMEEDKGAQNIQAAFLFMVLFCREVSKTEVKTTHVVNMGTAGKSGVMGQRNVKSHRSFMHRAKIATRTRLKPRTTSGVKSQHVQLISRSAN